MAQNADYLGASAIRPSVAGIGTGRMGRSSALELSAFHTPCGRIGLVRSRLARISSCALARRAIEQGARSRRRRCRRRGWAVKDRVGPAGGSRFRIGIGDREGQLQL